MTLEQFNKMKTLHSQGMIQSEIAKKLGISQASVCYNLRKSRDCRIWLLKGIDSDSYKVKYEQERLTKYFTK